MSEPVQHASDFLLDRASANELPPAALAALEAHLAQCRACSARRGALIEQRSAFLRRAPDWEAYARDGSRKQRRMPGWWVSAGVSLTLAASMWLGFVRAPRGAAPTSETAVRAKGEPQLGFYVKRGAQVWRGRARQPIRAGDVLRFTYSTPNAAHLAVFGRDANTATTLYPATAQAARIGAGVNVPLDFGLTLDAEPSTPVVYALFCRETFAVEPIRRQLGRAGPPPTAADGCSWQILELVRDP